MKAPAKLRRYQNIWGCIYLKTINRFWDVNKETVEPTQPIWWLAVKDLVSVCCKGDIKLFPSFLTHTHTHTHLFQLGAFRKRVSSLGPAVNKCLAPPMRPVVSMQCCNQQPQSWLPPASHYRGTANFLFSHGNMGIAGAKWLQRWFFFNPGSFSYLKTGGY